MSGIVYFFISLCNKILLLTIIHCFQLITGDNATSTVLKTTNPKQSPHIIHLAIHASTLPPLPAQIIQAATVPDMQDKKLPPHLKSMLHHYASVISMDPVVNPTRERNVLAFAGINAVLQGQVLC